MTSNKITPVILSGGAGTRLWPLSRAARPKQFHALAGSATMLQLTARRVTGEDLFTRPIVVASERHAVEIEAQLAAEGVEPLSIMLEPAGRNTAAAIALAALEADGAALLLVMPSDHVIGRPDRLLAAVEEAAPFAERGHLVTFGIAPDRPETGYGYIKSGAALAGGVHAVERFVEKPDARTAARFLQEGGYHWNGGIFLFRADAVLAGLQAHAPDILAAVRASFEAARRDASRVRPDPGLFAAIRSQSIDHALMEVHERVAIVPVDMDWSDVGTWDSLHEIAEKDAGGNALSGDVIALTTRDCLLHSDGRLLVTLGVHDLIVVATKDAVMILPRGQGQHVKDLVDLLKAADHPATRD